MAHPVVSAARECFRKRVLAGTVSEHTRNAQAIARKWRTDVVALDPSRYQHEVSVHPEFEQRIDVLDRQEMCAFEFKVSGKSASAEFSKDIVKVLLWNERHDHKIRKLVFITEEKFGSRHLATPMPKAFIEFLKKHDDLDVEVEYVRSD